MTAAAVYQPDLLFHEGVFHSGLALEVGPDGRILGVRARKVEGAVRLAGRALLPGLVDAHSHAFQRLLRGRTERTYAVANALGPEDLFVASRQAFLEMAHAGVTTVGEFHSLHHQPDGTPYADRNELAHQVIRAAREVGLRICLLRVGYARAGFQVPDDPRERRFIDPGVDHLLQAVTEIHTRYKPDPHVTVGVAPHSVRAVPREWIAAVGARPEVVHIHVCEQAAEVAACRAEHGKTPVELLDELGILRPDFTAVHAVHLEESDVQLLGRGGVSICACPSTEQDLGDGIVPADHLLHAGAELCLGSGSQLSIDLLGEARALEGHLRLLRQRRAVLDPGGGHASGLAARLFGMATAGGARSLDLPVGVLAPGKPADFFTVDLAHPSVLGAAEGEVLAAIVFAGEKGAIRDVAVQGRLILQDGRHALDESAPRDFEALAQRVRA